jgi:hypothetical protein
MSHAVPKELVTKILCYDAILPTIYMGTCIGTDPLKRRNNQLDDVRPWDGSLEVATFRSRCKRWPRAIPGA